MAAGTDADRQSPAAGLEVSPLKWNRGGAPRIRLIFSSIRVSHIEVLDD